MQLLNIRQVVETAFATRDTSGLIRLLGFDATHVCLTSLRDSFDGLAVDSVLEIHLRGMRGTLACYELKTDTRLEGSELARVTRALRAHNLTQLQLYVVATEDYTRLTVATYGVGDQLLTLTLQRERLHAADLETLQEMAPAADDRGSALAVRHARALDRTRVTRRFFADFAAQRDRVAAGWIGISSHARRDRDQLALLLLSRLMFLYFLQHRGYLASDTSYLARRFHAWRGRLTFYAGALKPLFFSVLNRRPERRPPRARSFGDVPYLNGGLFDRHVIERKYERIDLANSCLAPVFDDLLERYRFTASEASDAQLERVHDVGVDPEMLGRVFEGLMAERVRATTGTFYTPAAVVDRLVCNALVAYLQPRIGPQAAPLVRHGSTADLDPYQRRFTSTVLRETKVLDPACGSGAFLLGTLARVAQARAALDGGDVMAMRRELVARSLFGVDLQSDAALLCALRLWLALVPGRKQQIVQPLPNLDRQIRQGDSLIDPLDLRVGADPQIRSCIAQLQPMASAYVSSEPEQRPTLQRMLLRVERGLARAWVAAHQRRLAYQTAELRAVGRQADLFGALTPEAIAARSELKLVMQGAAEIRKLDRDIHGRNENPFFSFAVHFPGAALQGFDIVLCNPPWVRSHNWPRTITSIVRQRFQVCRYNSWHPPHGAELFNAGGPRDFAPERRGPQAARTNQKAAAGGNQIDLALLFLERSIDLLATGGVLGIILPAKFMRSLSGAAARKLLLERMDIISVEDHSLDQRSIFAADAFAAVIVARKRTAAAASNHHIDVACFKRSTRPLAYSLKQCELPLFSGDVRAPWVLVPPDVRAALMRMHTAPSLGAHPGLSIRRGVVTGANDVMLLIRADAKLGNLSVIQAEGCLASASARDFECVVETAAVAPALRGCDVGAWRFRRERHVLCRPFHSTSTFARLAKYLSRHGRTLADVPKIQAPGPLLCWHDLANSLKAVVVPRGIVAINTVYFIPMDEAAAHLLCAYFNSLPLRTFARAIAERAKDAHFRFFAWTVSLLPLPANWRSFEAGRLRELSRLAHAAGSLDPTAQAELDSIVANAYSLNRADIRALTTFDAWLRSAAQVSEHPGAAVRRPRAQTSEPA